MKRNFKRASLVIALIIIMVQLLSVLTFAQSNISFINWTLSVDEKVIEGNGRLYTKYEYADVVLDAADIYRYSGSVYFSSGESYRVYAPAHDSEFIWLESRDAIEIYATDTGRAYLESFMAGEGDTFRIVNGVRQKSLLDAKCISAMNTSADVLEIDVRELRDVDSYEIYAYDSTDTLAYKYGAVFFYGDELLFVRYSELENNCFDADGNFSFRSGSVSMKVVDGDSTSKIKLAGEGMAYRSAAHHYENFSDATPDIPKVFFWMCCLFVGFVLPLPILGLGLLMPRLRFLSRPKSWYSLAVIATAWMLLSAVLIILLLL